MKRWKLYFRYDHLPPHLQAVSKPFHDLAESVNDGRWSQEAELEINALTIGAVDENEYQHALSMLVDARWHTTRRGWRGEAMRQLLQAKDCAVRAYLPDRT